ncbi:MAG: transglutaminaseTgpA domain-containing protein [Acidobacteriota bacterium]
MRWPRAEELLPAIGPGALLMARPDAPALPLLLLAALAASARLQIAPRRLAPMLCVLFLGGAVLDATLVGWFTRLTIVVGVALALSRRERERALKLVVVSFLLFLAAAAQTEDVAFAIPFLAFVALAPAGLAAIELGARAAAPPLPRNRFAGALVLAASLPIYLAMPRGGHQLLGSGEGVEPQAAAMSDRIDLDAITKLKESSRVAMRVKVDRPVPESHLWRGVAFDAFDGATWQSGARIQDPVRFGRALTADVRSVPAGEQVVHQEFEIEPGLAKNLFTTRTVVRIGAHNLFHPRLDRRGDDYLLLWVLRGSVTYFVDSVPSIVEPEEREELDRCLRLPALAPRIGDLARRIAAGPGSDPEKLRAIEAYFQGRFTYALRVTRPREMPVIEHFLFEDRRGHCELFATGMVLLARSIGIPARLVDGFRRGEYSEGTSSYVVRRSDAHAWVEAYVDGRGWLEFDPTPVVPPDDGMVARLRSLRDSLVAAWNGAVIDFGSSEQVAVLHAVARTAPVAIVAGASSIGALVLARGIRRKPRSNDAIASSVQRAIRILAKAGIAASPGSTCREIAAAARRVAVLPSFDALVALHEEVVYGARPVNLATASRVARRHLRELRREVWRARLLEPHRSGSSRLH